MNRFAGTVEAHESAPDDARRAQVWRTYFEDATDREAAAAIGWLFAPWRPAFARSDLVSEVRTRSGLPEWFFAESLRSAGDAADALCQLLGPAAGTPAPDLAPGLEALKGSASADQAVELLARLEPWERWPFMKRCLGGRLGVGLDAVAEGFAEARARSRVSVARWLQTVAREGMGSGELPLAETQAFGPVPFARIVPRPAGAEPGSGMVADHLWPGQRVQIARDEAGAACWSEDSRTIAVTAPHLVAALEALPARTLIEGVLLPGGKELVVLDLLIEAGEDLRRLPLTDRRARLRSLVGTAVRCPGPMVVEGSFDALRDGARTVGALGLVVKRAEGAYREPPAWQAWSCDPIMVRGVLLYAQRGAGRYELPTFGVWSGEEPVPLAKTALGLAESERDLMDRYVRNNAIERSGPVLAVRPEWVYEIAIEEAWPSSRHRCGLKVAKARVLCRREDLRPEEADSLASVVGRFGLAVAEGGRPQ